MFERERLPSRAWATSETLALFDGLPNIRSTYHWLLRQGVPSAALIHPELPRRASVIFHTHQPLFDFAEDPSDATCDALVFLARDNMGDPADLVACLAPPEACGAFRLGKLLGADDLLRAPANPRIHTAGPSDSFGVAPSRTRRAGRCSSRRTARSLNCAISGPSRSRTWSTAGNCDNSSGAVNLRSSCPRRGLRRERPRQT